MAVRVEDILHVRLQTLGVTEHTFDINFGGGHYNWYLYDVGGAVRTFSSSSFFFLFFLGPPLLSILGELQDHAIPYSLSYFPLSSQSMMDTSIHSSMFYSVWCDDITVSYQPSY